MSIRFWSTLAVMTLAAAGANAGVASAQHGDAHGAPVEATKNMKLTVSTRPAPGGVLVRARTRGFRWAPEHLSPVHGEGEVVRGEGHGHVYLDGSDMPTIMVVSEWTFLRLKVGKHRLRVTLNANNHEEYQRAGKAIEDTVRVTMPAPTG